MESNGTDSGKMRHLGLTRRAWVQRMLAGVGAGIAAPTIGGARPIIANPTAGSTAAQSEAATPWKPAFFDDHQNQTVVVLAEKIVPGSTSVQANRFLDLALDAETQEVQQKFVSSLSAIEGETLRRFAKSFIDASGSQQDEVLTAASTGESLRPVQTEGEASENGSAGRSQVPSLRDYFDYLKDWISMAYYSSEVGMKELGWTGENYFDSFPGCQHSADHS
jgi:hypothetical protein